MSLAVRCPFIRKGKGRKIRHLTSFSFLLIDAYSIVGINILQIRIIAKFCFVKVSTNAVFTRLIRIPAIENILAFLSKPH